jgi:hypothetical protein
MRVTNSCRFQAHHDSQHITIIPRNEGIRAIRAESQCAYAKQKLQFSNIYPPDVAKPGVGQNMEANPFTAGNNFVGTRIFTF